MIVAWLIAGSGVAGWSKNGPAPEIANWIVSGGALVARLELRIACRSEPGPLSLVLVTTNVFGATVIVTWAVADWPTFGLPCRAAVSSTHVTTSHPDSPGTISEV